ncbi:Os03g0412850, partial [Oryza sativa Japonica Group]
IFSFSELANVTPADVVVGGEVVRSDGSPAAVRVELGCHLVGLEVGEDGGEDGPGGVELVAADEEAALALDGVEQQALVGVGDLGGVALGVEQVEVAAVQPHPQPGHLAVDLEVDRLVGLHPQHQLVRRLLQLPRRCRPAAAHAPAPPPVQRLYGPSRVQGLAGLHEEGDAVPAGVVDEEGGGGERRRDAAARHRRVVHVRRVRLPALAVPLVLTHHHVLQPQLPHRPQHFHLLVADVLGVEADRSLHGEQGQDLQQVVLHYVPDDPVVVETRLDPPCRNLQKI